MLALKCGVSSLMRAVSRATWTSGLPVSLAPRACCLTMSCLLMLANAMIHLSLLANAAAVMTADVVLDQNGEPPVCRRNHRKTSEYAFVKGWIITETQTTRQSCDTCSKQQTYLRTPINARSG